MGRTRSFDIEEAMGIAMRLFWQKGYEGTSLNDLTTAIGIMPPSFYSAFESKENLYRRVIQRYHEALAAAAEQAFQQPTARNVAKRLLSDYADLVTGPGHAPGCLVLNSYPPFPEENELRRWVDSLGKKTQQKLRDRFVVAHESGDLPADTDPEALARFVWAVGSGMAVDAQSGASREDLYRTLAVALVAVPEGGGSG